MTRKTKPTIYRIIGLVIGIGILLTLVYRAGFERFWDIILQTSPQWIALSVAVYAASWIFRTWRLHGFATHAGKSIKMVDLFALHISGYALNAVLPAKLGDVATVGYLTMREISIGRSAAIVLQTRILDVLALVLLSLPAFVSLLRNGAPSWIMTTVLLCTVIVAVPIGIVALDKGKRFSNVWENLQNRFGHKLPKLALEKTREAYEAYHEIATARKLMVASILLSLVIWVFDGLTCYAVSIAVGAHVPILAVILAVSMANIGKIAPATPGSIGIYEGILAAVLVLFGVSFDVAVVIAILDHAVKKLFNLGFGLPATMALGLTIRQIYQMGEKKDH